jgi:hypothetical protein
MILLDTHIVVRAVGDIPALGRNARALDCALMTADENILDYAAAGHLKAIDARE